ncbi:MAG: hypothetical protein Q7U47_11220 [Paludibacter sp.]|nr:hypothetical protein [Paludibacter sp.]
MHLNTNISNLTPVLVVSPFATYSPQGAQNFSTPKNYIVTAQNGTQKSYTVSVQLIDMVFNGPFPYETISPAGFIIPSWMSSPNVGGIVFNDPYGTPTTGSDKVLWYDNQTEIDAATA